MALDIHIISAVDGGAPTRSDRVLAMFLPNQATPAGSGAGAAVTINVATNIGLNYGVQVTPSMDAVPSVTKTATGFTVSLSPRLAANTLPAGTVDILVFA